MYEINLLPAELRGGSRIDRRKLYFRAVIVFAFVILAGVYCGFMYRFFLLQNEVAAANRQLAELLPRVRQIESLQKKRANAQAQLDAFKSLTDNRKQWLPVLVDINAALPADIWLTRINIYYDAGKVDLSTPEGSTDGTATGSPAHGVENGAVPNVVVIEGKSASVQSVGLYLHGLSDSKYFEKTSLDSMQESSSKGIVSFVITGYMKESGQ